MKIALLPLGHRALPTGGKSIFAPGVIATRIAEELTRRGHQVEVFAPADSHIKAKVKSLNLESMFGRYHDLKEKQPALYLELLYQYELFVASALAEESKNYDLIHAHDYRKIIYFSKFLSCPIVYTYHGSPVDDLANEIDKKRFQRFYNNNYFVAVSKQQVELGKKYLNFVGVVHHGVDVNKILYTKGSSDELLFVGRLMKRKGPDIAIKIAQTLNRPIRLVGAPYPTPEDRRYFQELVEPLINSKNVIYEGMVHHSRVYNFYRNAKVLLFPIDWEEPFGLVVPEANACGTPVVAFARGSMPELIKGGVNGFLVNPGDIDGMVKAVKKIYEMPADQYQAMRRACRKHVEANFTVEKMVDGYEAVYQKVIADWQKRHSKG